MLCWQKEVTQWGVCFETELAINGHPWSLVWMPIETAYAAFLLCCFVSMILQVFCWKSPLYACSTQSLVIFPLDQIAADCNADCHSFGAYSLKSYCVCNGNYFWSKQKPYDHGTWGSQIVLGLSGIFVPGYPLGIRMGTRVPGVSGSKVKTHPSTTIVASCIVDGLIPLNFGN